MNRRQHCNNARPDPSTTVGEVAVQEQSNVTEADSTLDDHLLLAERADYFQLDYVITVCIGF